MGSAGDRTHPGLDASPLRSAARLCAGSAQTPQLRSPPRASREPLGSWVSHQGQEGHPPEERALALQTYRVSDRPGTRGEMSGEGSWRHLPVSTSPRIQPRLAALRPRWAGSSVHALQCRAGPHPDPVARSPCTSVRPDLAGPPVVRPTLHNTEQMLSLSLGLPILHQSVLSAGVRTEILSYSFD